MRVGDAVTGRKPVPTVLKVLRGTLRADRLNHDEPQPAPLDDDCPPELVDPVARAEWTRRIVPAIAAGHVTSADRALAIAHCEVWASRRSQLVDAARAAHVVAVGAQQTPAPNPAFGMAASSLRLLLKIDAELGFLPSSRTRVSGRRRPTGPHRIGTADGY